MGVFSVFRYRRPSDVVPPAAKFDVSSEGPIKTSREGLAPELARRLAPHLRGLQDGPKFYPKLEKRLVFVIENTDARALSRFKADVASELSKILGEGHPILKKFQTSEPSAYEDFVILLANERNSHSCLGKKPLLSEEQTRELSIMVAEFSPKNHRRNGSDGGGEFWRKYQQRLAESARETKAARILLRIMNKDRTAITPILVVFAVNESNP